MTKEEIQNNIQYNENLVRQYQQTLASLETKISTKNSQIKDLNAKISSYESKRRDLEEDIAELKKLKSKYTTLQEEFAKRQASRRNKLSLNFAQKAKSFKFLSSYVSGMTTLLSGSEYKSAYNGLSTAISTVNKKILSLQKEVVDYIEKTKAASMKITSYNAELTKLKNKRNDTEVNLMYRKHRIQYWKEQLKYAT